MGRANFDRQDFLRAAERLIDDGGPAAVTVGALAQALAAPTGSFYHRFGSRDILLAELWLAHVQAFQEGFFAALEAHDGLAAALHVPAWARAHPLEARLLLLHHRDDFVKGEWPEALRAAVAAQAAALERALHRFALRQFGGTTPEALRRSAFLLVDLPVALVSPHLRRREPVPAIVDDLITRTYRALTPPPAGAPKAAARRATGGHPR